MIFIVLDVLKPLGDKKLIEKELEGFGIRLNKKPPNIIFKKKEKGGINMNSSVHLNHLELDSVKAILSEYRIHNADISFKCDATADDLIDIIEVIFIFYIFFQAIDICNREIEFIFRRYTF